MIVKQKNLRILIIDDNEVIHNDFRRVLSAAPADQTLAALEQNLFDSPPPSRPDVSQISYELTSAYSGVEGLKQAVLAAQAGAPYAVAFVDIRMPAGWNGVETAVRLWEIMP